MSPTETNAVSSATANPSPRTDPRYNDSKPAGDGPNTMNDLGPGSPETCERCGTAYREISRLAGNGTVGYCPQCFEQYLSR